MTQDSEGRAAVRLAAALASIHHDEYLAVRLCEATRFVLGADATALTLDLLQGPREVLCATDESTEHFEQLQDLAGQGPGRDASASGEAFVATIGEDSFARWPALAELAERSGLTGTFWAIPMRPAHLVVGVLLLHSADGRLEEDMSTVQFIADAVGTALLRDPQLLAPDQDVTGTWSQKSRIFQATGMVVAQLSVSSDDALALMRANAYSTGIPLYELALDVIDHRVDFSDFTVRGD